MMYKKIIFIILGICFLFHNVAIATEEENLFDPTESESELLLTAIVISNKSKFCVINDKVLKSGSEIYGYFVTKIENDKVILQNMQKKIIILPLS